MIPSTPTEDLLVWEGYANGVLTAKGECIREKYPVSNGFADSGNLIFHQKFQFFALKLHHDRLSTDYNANIRWVAVAGSCALCSDP